MLNERKRRDNVKGMIRDILIACAIAFVISLFIRPTLVKETSMEPTVHPNDYVIMSKQAYTFGKIERGDIIVFKSDLKLDDNHNKLLIKRVIGIPGDIITISDGNVYLNGDKLEEPYIASRGTIGEIYNLTVPEASFRHGRPQECECGQPKSWVASIRATLSAKRYFGFIL